MFKSADSYIYQLVSANDGTRSPAFASSISSLVPVLKSYSETAAETHYVLLLAPIAGTDHFDVVRFPLYTVKNFLKFLSDPANYDDQTIFGDE